jgi:hypothetical protein
MMEQPIVSEGALMKKLFIALIFGFAAIAASVSAQTVAFTNVSLIPMDRERVLANQTVVIKNGLIAEIGNAKNVKLPKDAVRKNFRDAKRFASLPGKTCQTKDDWLYSTNNHRRKGEKT